MQTITSFHRFIGCPAKQSVSSLLQIFKPRPHRRERRLWLPTYIYVEIRFFRHRVQRRNGGSQLHIVERFPQELLRKPNAHYNIAGIPARPPITILVVAANRRRQPQGWAKVVDSRRLTVVVR